jgi:mannose/fructose/N-acetylgalactosamine-specific phosphotransferase system component IIB
MSEDVNIQNNSIQRPNYDKVRNPTVSDVLNAIDKLRRFYEFYTEFSKIAIALAGSGIDITRINPNNFGDLIKMVTSLNRTGVLNDIDIEALKDSYEDIMNMSINDLKDLCNTVRQFAMVSHNVMNTMSYISRTAKIDKDSLELVKSLLGIKTHKTEESEEEYEAEDLTEEEIEELRKMLKRKP